LQRLCGFAVFRRAQLDKQKDMRTMEFEEEVLSFEGKYQALVTETTDLNDRYKAQFTQPRKSTAEPYDFAARTSEEAVMRAKLRSVQLDEWIAEAHESISLCDKRIKKLGDVFQMMMVRRRTELHCVVVAVPCGGSVARGALPVMRARVACTRRRRRELARWTTSSSCSATLKPASSKSSHSRR
jgi:hypothetical protein